MLRGLGFRRQIAILIGFVCVLSACAPSDRSGGTSVPTTVDPCEEFANAEQPLAGSNPSFQDETVLEWDIATPEEVGLDSSVLEEVADDVSISSDITSLLIARHGRLVLERYFNGSRASEANDLFSVTKSVVSLLTGIAVDDGFLSTDTAIGDVLSEALVGMHGDLEVAHLLSMSAGVGRPAVDLDYDSDDPNLVRTALSYPAVAEPGTEISYNSGLSHVLGAVVTEATGQSLCSLASTRLFGPIGVDVDFWSFEPDGYFAGPVGLFITPREIARLGQLVLQGGRWEGEQLVSAEWLDASLTERWDIACRFPSTHIGYGWHWWTRTIAGHEVWNASGHGGQDLLILPDLDLVVVVTHDATSYDPVDHEQVGTAELIHALLPALDDAGEMPSACADNGFTTWRINADGTGRMLMPNWPVGAVAWSQSPDGERLVVTSGLPDLNEEIYTMAPDGSGWTRLTRDFAADGQPAWSPDGLWVAFVRGSPGVSDLYVVRPDGTETRRVTGFAGFEHHPTWSHDSTRLAFIRGPDANAYGVAGELWTIGIDGTDPTMLLAGPVAAPTWSLDGTRILFETSTHPDPGRIGYLDLATGEIVDLGEGALPRWSPDGRHIAYVVESAGGLDVFTMDADGGTGFNVTNGEGVSTLPLWLGNDNQLLYVTRPPAG